MIGEWVNYFLGLLPSLVSFLDSWEVVAGVTVAGFIVAFIVASVITNTLYNRGSM